MTNRERLTRIAGVWAGTYTHLTPDGKMLEQFASRQECRLEGDNWYERIIYQYADKPDVTLDFRARFDGDELVFDDLQIKGDTFQVTDEIMIFAYHWKDNPQRKVVETIVCDFDNIKSRIWQTFDHGVLTKVTIIDEHRVNEQPELWY